MEQAQDRPQSRSRRKAVTIYDVADKAGVAPSTVSRALRQPGRVSPETSQRIYDVAETLGYQISTVPRRAPGTEDTYVIALVIADVGNPYFTQLMIGLQESARQEGYTVMLIDSRENAAAEKAAIERVLHLIDGVVLSSSRMTNSAIQHLGRTLPVVSLNRRVPGITSIVPDTADGMRKVVEYLAGQGHREISYLAGPPTSWADGARWEALTLACAHHGLQSHRLGPHAPTVKGGFQAFAGWQTQPTSAVLAYNDLLALGFCKSAAAQGINVPQDVSVIGIDDAAISSLYEPALTSLATRSQTLGKTAAKAILGHLRHRSQTQPQLTTLEMRLQLRDSVGPATGKRKSE